MRAAVRARRGRCEISRGDRGKPADPSRAPLELSKELAARLASRLHWHQATA